MAATSAEKKSSPASMPIEDYDRLPIKEILPLLKALSSRDLKAVAAYEKARKNRVTLLRGVRKIELAREAAATQRPAKAQLTIVEAAPAPAPAPAPVAMIDLDLDLDHDLEPITELRPDFDFDFAPERESEFDIDFAPEPAPEPKAKARSKAKTVKAKTVKAKATPEPAAVPVTTADKPRLRPAVKAATWEEEVQPQLPRQFQTAAAAFELDYDTPSIALDSSEPTLVPDLPARSKASDKTSGPKAAMFKGRPAQMAKKFENVALVMAAILAILLGLAIGTVLARSGSTDPTPPASASQAAVVQTAG